MSSENPRLHKALAAAGVASRRACEELIAHGRVSVNGEIVKVQGLCIDPEHDQVMVDGDPIDLTAAFKPIYIMLNKPAGVVTTAKDPQGRATVMSLVEQTQARLFPVGRLDTDTSGLLILTNDGDFAHKILHPRFHIPRTYQARVKGFLEEHNVKRLMEGIDLPDGKTAPATLKFLDYDRGSRTTLFEITIFEGRNRQVRRMLEAVGNPVRELTRIAFGSLRLQRLNPGTWRKLSPSEIQGLLDQAASASGRMQ